MPLAWRQCQRFPQRHEQKLFEDYIHVQHERGAGDFAVEKFQAGVVDNQSGQFHRGAVVVIERGIEDLWDTTAVAAKLDRVEHRTKGINVPPGLRRPDRKMRQPVQRGLEQPILLDVLSELVKGHFNGQRDAEATLDLFAEPDAAPDSMKRLLLPPISLQQAAPHG